jgi:TolA-binding protein
MCWIVLFLCGCGVSLQQAREREDQGKHEQALIWYRQIAQREGTEEARLAQISVLRLLQQLSKWQEIPGESTRLVSFLDPEDTWMQKFQNNPVILQQGKDQIASALFDGGVYTLEQATKLGDPIAYIAAGQLFGLYLSRFPNGSERTKAAAGRGITFAVRGDCRTALKWLHRSIVQDKPKQLTPATIEAIGSVGVSKPPSVIEHKAKITDGIGASKAPGVITQRIEARSSLSLSEMAWRGLLGCQIRLWQEQRVAGKTASKGVDKTKKAASKVDDLNFEQITVTARRVIEQAGQEGTADIFHHVERLLGGGAFVESLRLLLAVALYVKQPQLVEMSKRQMLQIFGMTEHWEPLLGPLQQHLEQIPPQQRDLFWQRVQSLISIHGLRQAQTLLTKRKARQAVPLLLSVYRTTPPQNEVIVMLYTAAIILEEQREFEQAIYIYKMLFEGHPKNEIAPMARYRHSLSLEALQQLEKSAHSFMRLARYYPQHMIASRALYHAYQIFTRIQDQRRAAAMRSAILRRYPQSMEAQRLRK